MKQSVNFEVESITVAAAKIPVTLKGIRIHAECEYNSEEMAAKGTVVNSVIEQISQKLGWLKPLAEKALQIKIKNMEILSENFQQKVAEGTQGAYGPNGWYAKSETTETAPYDPNKDYSHKVETKTNEN